MTLAAPTDTARLAAEAMRQTALIAARAALALRFNSVPTNGGLTPRHQLQRKTK